MQVIHSCAIDYSWNNVGLKDLRQKGDNNKDKIIEIEKTTNQIINIIIKEGNKINKPNKKINLICFVFFSIFYSGYSGIRSSRIKNDIYKIPSIRQENPLSPEVKIRVNQALAKYEGVILVIDLRKIYLGEPETQKKVRKLIKEYLKERTIKYLDLQIIQTQS